MRSGDAEQQQPRCFFEAAQRRGGHDGQCEGETGGGSVRSWMGAWASDGGGAGRRARVRVWREREREAGRDGERGEAAPLLARRQVLSKKS